MVLHMEMDIGARLKEARESKGLSLDEVQQTTKIQKRYLNAIEQNEFDTLPGKFYTRAFIREYASAVGLNPEEVMEEHKGELPSYEEEEIVKYSRAQRTQQQTTKSSSGKATSLFPRILTAVAVIAVAIAIYVFMVNSNGSADDSAPADDGQNDAIELPPESEDSGEEADDSTSEEAEEEPAEEAPAEPEAEEEPEEPAQPEVAIELTQEGTGDFPEHVYTVTGVTEQTATIELSGAAYLAVQSPKGEDLITEGMYDAEDSPISLDFTGKNQLYVKTGSAPTTSVIINGEPVPYPDPGYSTQKLLLNFEQSN
ncbi:helix-turn-helix domain-containing protein [Halobacillus litoralis]|uniref:helix-turn-helix domain-containing protein n=1 Tax=Halobacillus litoralis TaxID=45668 RepID=UPI001CD5968C|nr:helix-turn-helix domain-containing protein [Halobacillus litoralis]MCA0969070.1 helix-turn-helix domain-containing protein [Halobacillus litoralis]